ncbi:transcriptional regulator, TetR family [Nannocystis exedens]|uniref:Transcriptional regulator, TetR family n=1 Tax=Nannocystis exedens TaxID=54 RepID=A0A1I2I2B5_9BACT|nr:TetR/AcrR family transcriptional regulator [Nannocystis exedens]PCC74914.1 HTH-type transcriptional repressor AcnR [Nannocystis exedens]SFF36549.1 transcriptional regulator, TetR family [Nannocystis exedens]
MPSQTAVTLPELLEVARRLLDEAGPEALTMDRLAEAAGISRSSAYRLVGSREALVQQLAAAGVDAPMRGDAREKVLAAARDVFSRQGLEGATIEAIAEAAGVGTATVYRQFGDKKGLLRAFAESMNIRQVVWGTAREPSGDLAVDLERLAVAALTQMRDDAALMRIIFVERLRGSSVLGELADAPDRSIHGLAALLRRYVERGELVDDDPYRLARAFQGLLFGFGLLGSLWGLPGDGDGDPERDARTVVAFFLRGVKRGAP